MLSDTSRAASPHRSATFPIILATPPVQTPDCKRGRGRPKGVKNKAKPTGNPASSSKSPGFFSKIPYDDEVELDSLNSSAASTPRSQSPVLQVGFHWFLYLILS